ncbi:MAG: choice-of-anchor M domain-containing protein [Fimbriiglobus sp.]
MSKSRSFLRLEANLLEDRVVPTFFTTIYSEDHIDLTVNYSNSQWNLGYEDETLGAVTTARDTLIYAPAVAKAAVPTTAAYSFIGAGSSGSAYILPQTQNPDLVFLGVGAEDTFPTSLASYRPNNDPRVPSSPQPWIRLDLMEVRGPGKFSVYQTNAQGQPVNWMATNDGISAKDVIYVAAGGHAHYNFAFTAPGIYEVDMKATGYLAANQTNPTSSETKTFYFSVDPAGPTNTVPSAGASSKGGASVVFDLSNKISVAGPTTAPAPVSTTITSSKNGILNLATISGVGVVSGEGSSSVNVIGSLDQINKALNGMKYTPGPDFNGVDTITVTSNDGGEYRPSTLNVQTDTDTFGVIVSGNTSTNGGGTGGGTGGGKTGGTGGGTSPTVPPAPTFPLGSPQAARRWMAIGASTGSPASVTVVDTETLESVSKMTPYAPSFTGGVRTAVADFLKDGTPEIVTAPALGGGPHIQVFDRLDANPRLNFFAFDAKFTGGVTLALGDFNGDTVPDIVVGAGPGGGPHVRIFDGRTGSTIRNLFAFESTFKGGVNVAAGDINADGITDLVVGAGPGGGPAVAVFDGKNFADVRRFFAYSPKFTGGVNVAVGDVTGLGASEIIIGAGEGGGPHVQVMDGSSLANIASFFAVTPNNEDNRGVEVSLMDFNRDLQPQIVTVTNRGNVEESRLRYFDLSTTLRPQGLDLKFTDSFNGGIYVEGMYL